mgnify:CR=1
MDTERHKVTTLFSQPANQTKTHPSMTVAVFATAQLGRSAHDASHRVACPRAPSPIGRKSRSVEGFAGWVDLAVETEMGRAKGEQRVFDAMPTRSAGLGLRGFKPTTKRAECAALQTHDLRREVAARL